jgi:hypothetical protein
MTGLFGFRALDGMGEPGGRFGPEARLGFRLASGPPLDGSRRSVASLTSDLFHRILRAHMQEPIRRDWTRDELMLSLNLYYKLPFGKLHSTHPLIQQVAAAMGRTSASLSMKLCNLASLDPALRARGKKGLPNASQLDREVWEEYHENWDRLTVESEARVQELLESQPAANKGTTRRRRSAPAKTETAAQRKARVGQDYFRDIVLAAYDTRCCVTGNRVPELLRASHIVPWKDDEANRLNPCNGLCLSAEVDAAFDRGLVAFDEERRFLVSRYLVDFMPDEFLERSFMRHVGKSLHVPKRFEPADEFLAWHRKERFRGERRRVV